MGIFFFFENMLRRLLPLLTFVFIFLPNSSNAYPQKFPPGMGVVVERKEIPTNFKMITADNNAGAMLGLRGYLKQKLAKNVAKKKPVSLHRYAHKMPAFELYELVF